MSSLVGRSGSNCVVKRQKSSIMHGRLTPKASTASTIVPTAYHLLHALPGSLISLFHRTVRAPAFLTDRDLSAVLILFYPELNCSIAMHVLKLERIFVAVPHSGWQCCYPCLLVIKGNPEHHHFVLHHTSSMRSGQSGQHPVSLKC
jgi:hypothetical protein